jgi:hypothetical protein
MIGESWIEKRGIKEKERQKEKIPTHKSTQSQINKERQKGRKKERIEISQSMNIGPFTHTQMISEWEYLQIVIVIVNERIEKH